MFALFPGLVPKLSQSRVREDKKAAVTLRVLESRPAGGASVNFRGEKPENGSESAVMLCCVFETPSSGSCDETLKRKRTLLSSFCTFHWSYLNVILSRKTLLCSVLRETLAALLFVLSRISFETFTKTSSANISELYRFAVNEV